MKRKDTTIKSKASSLETRVLAIYLSNGEEHIREVVYCSTRRKYVVEGKSYAPRRIGEVVRAALAQHNGPGYWKGIRVTGYRHVESKRIG